MRAGPARLAHPAFGPQVTGRTGPHRTKFVGWNTWPAPQMSWPAGMRVDRHTLEQFDLRRKTQPEHFKINFGHHKIIKKQVLHKCNKQHRKTLHKIKS